MVKELITSADIPKTSVDNMDKEHDEVVEIINKMWELVNSNPEQDALDSEIIEVSNKLMTHIEGHFLYEQGLMDEVNFPAISLHINEHNLFLKKLKKAINDFIESKDISKLKQYISETLRRDFIDHIMVLDTITSKYYLLKLSKPE
jgi:hemerythrin